MNRGSYVTTASVVELKERLLPADWAVLRDVETMRVAAALDLQVLANLRQPVPVRTFRRRLQRLHDQGVLARLERRVGGVSAGSAGWVYVLGVVGQRLLDDQGVASVRRPWTPRPSWLRHALASSHLYVVVKSAEAAGKFQLRQYQSEPDCWRPFMDEQRQVVLKPDAFISVEIGDEIASLFIEVDCATESPVTLRAKQAVYWSHYLTNQEQAAHGLYPEVLWLVPTVERRAVIERVIASHAEPAQVLHRVVLYADALQAVLEPP